MIVGVQAAAIGPDATHRCIVLQTHAAVTRSLRPLAATSLFPPPGNKPMAATPPAPSTEVTGDVDGAVAHAMVSKHDGSLCIGDMYEC